MNEAEKAKLASLKSASEAANKKFADATQTASDSSKLQAIARRQANNANREYREFKAKIEKS